MRTGTAIPRGWRLALPLCMGGCASARSKKSGGGVEAEGGCVVLHGMVLVCGLVVAVCVGVGMVCVGAGLERQGQGRGKVLGNGVVL